MPSASPPPDSPFLRPIETRWYTDPSVLDDEKNRIFQQAWLLAGWGGQVRHPNSYFSVRILGQSYVISRDDKGHLHATVNVCLHRGTQLVPDRTNGTGSQLSCPYHGWRYSMTGTLEHITLPEGIPNAARVGCTLRKIHVEERAGLIWICLSSPDRSIDDYLGNIADELNPYQLQSLTPIQQRDFRFPINWKLSLENALDYYHVSTVHQSTVGAHVKTGPTFTARGIHNLQSLHIAPYGFRKWLDRHCARGGPYSQSQLDSLQKYYLFPNLILNVLPYHLTIMQLWPVDANHCIMRYVFLMRKGASIIERTRAYATWLASRWILYEDVKIYDLVHNGFHSGEVPLQPLHTQESAIGHFHQSLQDWPSIP